MLDDADPTNGGHGKVAIAGYEYDGEIAAVGPDAGDWTVDDPVMGTFPNAFGEYVVADHRFVLKRPEILAPEVASSLPTALLTETGALRVAHFESGQSALITGGTTGIGLAGIQIAKALGASKVIATTRTAAKRELLEKVGADVVIVTDDDDLVETTHAATGDTGADVVLDHIAGQTFAQALKAVAEDGHVVNIGRLAGPASEIDLDDLSHKHLSVSGVSFGFSRDWETVPVLESLRETVLPAVAAGEIAPVFDSSYPVEDIAQATERLRSGEATGKVVLTFA